MKIYLISDLHIDFQQNRKWLESLSPQYYRSDILVLAGDVTHDLGLLARGLKQLRDCFREVAFVPGNHDLWVAPEGGQNSLQKFDTVRQLAEDLGLHTGPLHIDRVSIVPLFAWYDFSFGQPVREIRRAWMDFKMCRWPQGHEQDWLGEYFAGLNEPYLNIRNRFVVSFSHFLPRIDLMPAYIPAEHRKLYPVLGTSRLETQIRTLRPDVHAFGHSHVNMRTARENILYINNAFGYPKETRIAAKKLLCIHET